MFMTKKRHSEIVTSLKVEVTRLTSLVCDLRSKLENGGCVDTDLDADFDFVGKQAFSIERDRYGKTVIGFLKDCGETLEDDYWYGQTTNEVHRALVSKFRKYIRNKETYEQNK